MLSAVALALRLDGWLPAPLAPRRPIPFVREAPARQRAGDHLLALAGRLAEGTAPATARDAVADLAARGTVTVGGAGGAVTVWFSRVV